LDERTFKYHIDFDRLRQIEEIGLIAVSRPTNPTGNVLTRAEIEQLSAFAGERGAFLMIDNAYGAPFPNIIFSEAEPHWEEHIILSFSLSKLGLPGTRTGIVIASKEIIAALAAANAIIGLANCNIGQALTAPMFADGSLVRLCREAVTPYYAAKAAQALRWIDQFFPGEIPYRVHKSEGALFLWLWLEGLPISSQQLYQRLAARRVVVVPGHHFFFGLEENGWKHRHECLRINYSQPEETVKEGLRIIAEEAAAAYQHG
jgi:valine--pyruvate aminotransferase